MLGGVANISDHLYLARRYFRKKFGRRRHGYPKVGCAPDDVIYTQRRWCDLHAVRWCCDLVYRARCSYGPVSFEYPASSYNGLARRIGERPAAFSHLGCKRHSQRSIVYGAPWNVYLLRLKFLVVYFVGARSAVSYQQGNVSSDYRRALFLWPPHFEYR